MKALRAFLSNRPSALVDESWCSTTSTLPSSPVMPSHSESPSDSSDSPSSFSSSNSGSRDTWPPGKSNGSNWDSKNLRKRSWETSVGVVGVDVSCSCSSAFLDRDTTDVSLFRFPIIFNRTVWLLLLIAELVKCHRIAWSFFFFFDKSRVMIR